MNYYQIRKRPLLCGILNKFQRFPYLRSIKSIRLNPNISKYWEFGELKVPGLGTKMDRTSKYGTNFFIIKRHYK